MMSWRPVPKNVYYYCDESSFDPAHTFAAVGGLAVPGYYRRQIANDLLKIKHDLGINPESEIKWKWTSSRRHCPQTAYAKYLAHLIEENIVNIHLIFAPFSEFNHRANDGREGSVGRLFNELIIFRPLQFYGPHSTVHIRPDEGTCTAQIAAHLPKAVLEAARRERRGAHLAANIRSCVGTFRPKSSAKSPFLQLLDVTLGAFAALRNERKLAPPKAKLAALVHAMYGHPKLANDFPKDASIFSIWNLKGRGPKKQIGMALSKEQHTGVISAQS